MVEPGQVEEVALPVPFGLKASSLRKQLRPPSALPKLAHRLVERRGAPALAWVRTGRIWRVKGRIWSRIGAVVWSKKRSVASKAGPSACACGIRPISAGRAALREARWSWRGRPAPRRRVAGNSTQRLLDRLLLVGEVAERRLGGGDEAFDLGVVAAQFGGQQAEVVDHAGRARRGAAATALLSSAM